MARKGPGWINASDHLRARVNGIWAQEKLKFLDTYMPPAIQACETKLQRHFIDLFAGPGMNVDAKYSGHEFEGSTIRALRLRGSANERLGFTDVTAVNLDELDHAALQSRVQRMIESGEARAHPSSIRILSGNANILLPEILARIHKKAFAFVFADIENPRQWPWSSVQALRSSGHESIELGMLFPLDMALIRLFAYSRAQTEVNAHVLTSFFGTEAWRDLEVHRLVRRRAPELRRSITELYLTGLRALGWKHSFVVAEAFFRGRQRLYQVIYATDHEAGKRIAEWAVKHRRQDDPQRSFF